MPTDAFQRNHQVDGLSHWLHHEYVVQLTCSNQWVTTLISQWRILVALLLSWRSYDILIMNKTFFSSVGFCTFFLFPESVDKVPSVEFSIVLVINLLKLSSQQVIAKRELWFLPWPVATEPGNNCILQMTGQVSTFALRLLAFKTISWNNLANMKCACLKRKEMGETIWLIAFVIVYFEI